MDTKPAMQALERRAFEARTPLYKLCEAAGVSPARFTQSRSGRPVSVTTLDKLEKAMKRIEDAR